MNQPTEALQKISGGGDVLDQPLVSNDPAEIVDSHTHPFLRKASQYAWQTATFGMRQLTSRTGFGTLLALAPEAAAIIAMQYGPSAHVDNLPLEGSHITASVKIGHDSVNTSLGMADLRTPQPKTVLGKPIGAEIHADVSAVLSNVGSSDGQSVNQVSSILATSGTEVSKLQQRVVEHTEFLAAFTAGTIIEFEAAGFIVSRLFKRALEAKPPEEQASAQSLFSPFIRGGRLAIAGCLVPVTATGLAIASPLSNVHDTIIPSPVLHNTSLGTSQLTIPADNITQGLLQQGLNIFTNNQQVYEKIDHNDAVALAATFPNLAELHKSFLVVAVADDPQGVSGTLETFAKSAKQIKADVAIVDGDIGTGVSWYDNWLAKIFKDNAGNVPLAVSGGEHDSKALLTYMKSLGIAVPNANAVQTIGGLRFLLLPSEERVQLGEGNAPLATTPGLSNSRAQDEAIINTNKLLETQSVDSVVVHDSAEGDPIAESGRVNSVFEGRSYSVEEIRLIKKAGGYTLKLKSSSLGGHGAGDGPEFTVIHNDARYNIVLFDKATRKPAMVYTVTMRPDQSVDVSPPVILDGTQQYVLAK